VLLPQDHPAPRGDDVIWQPAQLFEQGPLLVPKARFALPGKDVPDAPAVPSLQDFVGIDPGPAELLGQQPGHGRLAAAAVADQKDEGNPHYSSSLMATGDRARLTTERIRSRGGSWPVNSWNWRAAWRTNMSTPVRTWQARSRASRTSRVVSGV